MNEATITNGKSTNCESVLFSNNPTCAIESTLFANQYVLDFETNLQHMRIGLILNMYIDLK